MKIQQLIYTSVKSSLSDVEKGLVNQDGFRVYSCSEGLSKEDISELIKYTSYRLPRNSNIGYSMKPCDPSVPELFPKTFRSFVLPSGKGVAMQSVYAGYDFKGNPGNFFAHAFIFEDPGEHPENYFNSPDFRTYLTEEEANQSIVRYLPELEEVKKRDGLWEDVDKFIEEHREQVMYLFAHAVSVMESVSKKHLTIICENQSDSEFYLLSLKRLIPASITEGTGISTYNIFLPSEKQTTISFNATVKDMNNITEKSMLSHPYCEIINMSEADFSKTAAIPLFDMPMDKLQGYYDQYQFSNITQFKSWLKTFDATEGGIGAKLEALKNVCGDEIYKARAEELYEMSGSEDMSEVYFELVTSMFDNLGLFEKEEDAIIKSYLVSGVESICMGESVNLENVFKNTQNQQVAAVRVLGYIGSLMDIISINFESINEKNAILLLRILSVIKHAAKVDTWRDMFKNNFEYLSIFVEISAMIMITTTSGTLSFTAPALWSTDEFAETIAYILSSTKDEHIINACEKYICENKDVEWEQFGIELIEEDKSPDEQALDLQKVKYMLSRVGYVPYDAGQYTDIKKEVIVDMTENKNPLLLSKLLWAYYEWSSCEGRPQEAQKEAEKVKDLLLEMREREPMCYNFIIPKLALEILDTYGHFHEIMINAETMIPSFWDWFLIGYRNAEGDMDIRTTYQRVYSANKNKMIRIPARSRLRKEFRNIE